MSRKASQQQSTHQRMNSLDRSDSIYLDSSLDDLRQQLILQQASQQQLTTRTLPIRNYIIYQPQQQLGSQRILSNEQSQSCRLSNNSKNVCFGFQEPNNESASMRYQTAQGNIEDTPSQAIELPLDQQKQFSSTEGKIENDDKRLINMDQFLYSNSKWQQEKRVIENILENKRGQLVKHYEKQEQKVIQLYHIIDQQLKSEQNQLLDALNTNKLHTLSIIQQVQSQLSQINEQLSQYSQDVIQSQNNSHYFCSSDAITEYYNLIQQFERYTKKTCQSIRIELISVDSDNYYNNPKYLKYQLNNILRKAIALQPLSSNLMSNDIHSINNSSSNKQLHQQLIKCLGSKDKQDVKLSTSFQNSNLNKSINQEQRQSMSNPHINNSHMSINGNNTNRIQQNDSQMSLKINDVQPSLSIYSSLLQQQHLQKQKQQQQFGGSINKRVNRAMSVTHANQKIINIPATQQQQQQQQYSTLKLR